MHNAWKVAKWEIKRNMKNKSFLIGLILTPLFFYVTMIVISLFSDSEAKQIDVFIADEIGVIEDVQAIAEQNELINWNIHELVEDEQTLLKQMSKEESIMYVKLTESSITNGEIPVFMTEDINQETASHVQMFKEPVQQYQLEKIGLTEDQQKVISHGITIQETTVQEHGIASSRGEGNSAERLIPGIFAGIVLFSIVMSGMMIFQSASQEKKDKLAEIILSSMTPNELMQGKIIGYFVLGLIQVFVWIVSLMRHFSHTYLFLN